MDLACYFPHDLNSLHAGERGDDGDCEPCGRVEADEIVDAALSLEIASVSVNVCLRVRMSAKSTVS